MCRYVLADAESRFSHYDRDNDDFITYDEYKTAMLGSVEGNECFTSFVIGSEIHPLCSDPDAIYDKHRQLTYSQAIERYNRRFKVADENGDGQLNVEEFADFLHPGESSGDVCNSLPGLCPFSLFPSSSLSFSLPSLSLAEVGRMKPIYADERMEEMDKNKDGKVSPDEYISESLTMCFKN